MKFRRADPAKGLSRWRRTLFSVALVVAAASTILNVVWNYSWLGCGGSPHGGLTGPGLWQRLGPFLMWSFIIASLLGLFGKRWPRICLVVWSVSMVFVIQFIYMLQFD